MGLLIVQFEICSDSAAACVVPRMPVGVDTWTAGVRLSLLKLKLNINQPPILT
jgi:hypothetical protein